MGTKKLETKIKLNRWLLILLEIIPPSLKRGVLIAYSGKELISLFPYTKEFRHHIMTLEQGFIAPFSPNIPDLFLSFPSWNFNCLYHLSPMFTFSPLSVVPCFALIPACWLEHTNTTRRLYRNVRAWWTILKKGQNYITYREIDKFQAQMRSKEYTPHTPSETQVPSGRTPPCKRARKENLYSRQALEVCHTGYQKVTQLEMNILIMETEPSFCFLQCQETQPMAEEGDIGLSEVL